MGYKTVDDYLDTQTEVAIIALSKLRENIAKVIPDAEEYIGYQIPTIRYKDKPLIGYAAFKNHCSLFIMSMKTATELKPIIKDFRINGVTIQFGFKQRLPQALLKKIIVARMRETDNFLKLKKQKATLRKCAKGHTYYKSSDCPTCPICEQERNPKEGFLSMLSAPAIRALENKGIITLKQLSKHSERDILTLHGMGKKAISILQKALKEEGLSFKITS